MGLSDKSFIWYCIAFPHSIFRIIVNENENHNRNQASSSTRVWSSAMAYQKKIQTLSKRFLKIRKNLKSEIQIAPYIESKGY